MRLLYDASVFGFAAEQASGRTGIYRVAERILRGIGRYPEVDLHVCATSSWTLLQSARSSFGANSPWPMARLASSGRADEYGGVLQWASRGLLRAIERLNQGIGKSSTEKHLWARAARRGCAIGVAAAAREKRRVE
ncbi:MAG: hypothetical protein JWO82_1422 [Akkermansiaceae bacterium]|nr:hypothetical protein [Akkermansiaceae bacterium]